MLGYLLRRLLSGAVALAGVAFVVFSVFYAFRPERFAGGDGYARELWRFLERAFLHLDLGRSEDFRTGSRPVVELLRAGLPADISLVVGGLASGALLGVALGVVAVRRAERRARRRRVRGYDVLAAVGMSAPVYWVGAMFVVLFHPEVGRIARLPISTPNTYVPLTSDPFGWFGSLWLPWLVLGLPLAAITMQMTRVSLRETLQEDFVRTARGKGVDERRVMRRHALRAAGAPLISLAGVTVGTLVTNAVLLEQTFSIPGTFKLMTGALAQADLPVIEGVAIGGALLVIAANIAADVAHALLDPRVRTG